MFLTRLLVLILFLVFVRFVVKAVRVWWALSVRRPEVRTRRDEDREPIRGGRVIDVEFTEESKEDARSEKNSR